MQLHTLCLKRKDKKGGKRINKSVTWTFANYSTIKSRNRWPLKQIFRDLNLTTHPLKMSPRHYKQMMDDGLLTPLIKVSLNWMTITALLWLVNSKGRVMVRTQVIPDDGSETIFIAERNSAHAANNDKVKIALLQRRRIKKPKVKLLIFFLERANDTFSNISGRLARQIGLFVRLSSPGRVIILQPAAAGIGDGVPKLSVRFDTPRTCSASCTK